MLYAVNILVAAIHALIRAAVTVYLWHGFAVPLGAPDITMTQAIGISLIAGLIAPQPHVSDKEVLAMISEKERESDRLLASIGRSLLGILLAVVSFVLGWFLLPI